MSTRANIVLVDDTDRLYFYRHSDGYPEGTMPSLELFIDAVRQGKIRDNLINFTLISVSPNNFH